VIAFSAAALVGEVLFRRVEAPMNAALRRRFDRRPTAQPLRSALTP